MRGAAVLLLLATVLAGCADDAAGPGGADGTTGSAAHAGHALGTHLLAPAWQVGDQWTLASPQQPSGAFRHVVSADRGEDWVVDTDSPEIAYFDARFDISFLGQVRKSDLAGSQGSTRVEFLRFPLQADMEWTTTWDGEPMTVRTLDVGNGRAQLEARRGDGSLYAEYTYDDRARYFSRFAFYAPDGTTLGFEWTLQSSGSGFSGPLLRWDLVELLAHSGPLPFGEAATFNVPPGLTDVWVEGQVTCTAGAVAIAVGPPQGPAENRGYTAYGACPYEQSSAYAVPPPAEAEQWGGILTSAPVSEGHLELHIFGRTATTFAAGQAPS